MDLPKGTHQRVKRRMEKCQIMDVDPTGKFDKKFGLKCNKYYIMYNNTTLCSGNTEELAWKKAIDYWHESLGIARKEKN